MSKPIVLDEQTKEFITLLHRGGTHRFTQRMGKFTTSAWSRVDEPLRILPQDKGDAIYFGVNPTTIRITDEDREKHTGKSDWYIEQRIGSKERTIQCINCVYREYDAKDFTGAEKKADKETIFQTNPDHYRGLALANVRNLNPQPSVIVASGGGYNCYWLLDATFVIAKDPDQHAAHINSYISDLQKRWVHADPMADQGVCDLRRVFRIPGTTNYKELYAPNYPTVSFIKYAPTETYAISFLRRLLPKPVVENVSVRTSHIQTKSNGVPFAGESVIAAFNRTHTITDLMTAYGYTKSYGDKWNRPDTKNRGIQLHTDNTIYTHSDGGKLQGKRLYTAFGLYCVHEHGGDAKAAVKQAAADMGMVRKPVVEEEKKSSPSFSAIVRGLRQWLQSVDFASMIPTDMQSSKGYRTLPREKRAMSAFIEIFEGYGKLSGPVSCTQGSLKSGLSETVWRNAVKCLIAAEVINRIEPENTVDGGAFWYEINRTVVGAVGSVVKALPYPAIYGTVFTAQKREDAFQRGGTKKQRAMATIKSFGPDACIYIDCLFDHGQQSQQSIMALTHMGKNTVSRITRILDEHEVIDIEKVGRENLISLQPDWLETVKKLTPHMPTSGKKVNLHLNAKIREGENCDRKLSRGIGDKEKLTQQRERAARAAFAIMESEVGYMVADADKTSERMRRLLRMDNLHRDASASDKTAATIELSMLNKQQAKPWFDAGKDTLRMKQLRQELENNEILIDVRQQMRQEAWR